MNLNPRTWSVAALAALSLVVAAGGRASAEETVPPPASTESPPAVGGSVGYFGEHGQIAASADLQFNILHETRSMGGGTTTSYQIQPALDYFVSTNASVGGLLGLRRDPNGDGSDTTTLSIGPRVGYNIPLGAVVSLWIRATLSYEHQSTSGGGTPSFTGYAIPLTLYAPFLWQPVPHFFLGVGPFIRTDLMAKAEGNDIPKRTDIGLSSTIGGYFGGL